MCFQYAKTLSVIEKKWYIVKMECPACEHENAEGTRFCAKCGALLPVPRKENEDPLIGKVVGGRFRITGILGEGGMGRVYTGEQQMGTSVRKVAVKTLLAEHAKDHQVVARFMRECGTVSELEHPNTIKVYDFGQTDTGELYIAMELLNGKSMESVMETGGPLDPKRTLTILEQICGSLEEAHDKGIVHRDLKPANIFLTTRPGSKEDYVKVLDFGIAKRDESTKQETKLTKQGTVLGTPPYMSPEQFKGQELDARSDIYSLAVVAFEMLTGKLPFEADNPMGWALQHLTAVPTSLDSFPHGAQIPSGIKNAIMHALQKGKDQRPANIREFYRELSSSSTNPQSLIAGYAPTTQSAAVDMTPNPFQSQPNPSNPGNGGYVQGQTQFGQPAMNFPVNPGYSQGQTQLGAPAFLDPIQTPSHSGASQGYPPPANPGYPQVPQQAIPSYGGQSYGIPPAPMGGNPSRQKSNNVLWIGIGSVLGIGAIVGIIIAVLPGPNNPDDINPFVPSTTEPSSTVRVSADPNQSQTTQPTNPFPSYTPPVGNPTGQVSNRPIPSGTTSPPPTSTVPTWPPTATPSSTAPAPSGDGCQKAIALASSNQTISAVNAYNASCKGQSNAKSAVGMISNSSVVDVRRKGCNAKAEVDAAASIGARGGQQEYKKKNCR